MGVVRAHMSPGDQAPRVSVVVPVRNRRILLRDLLEALGRQTFTDFEVVIVDDGSTDGSAAEAHLAGDWGLAVHVLATCGGGAVTARRHGVAVARGDVLAFTDSDCRPDPCWLAAGVAGIDEGADVVQGATVPARPPRALERTVWGLTPKGLYETCNVFYRRSAYLAAGGFDPDAEARLGFRFTRSMRGLGFGEDVILGWRVARRGASAFVPEALVEHHVFPPDLRDALRRACMAGAFPALVREVPELRNSLLRHRFILGGPERCLLYFGAIARLVGGRRVAAAAAGGWVAARARRLWRKEPGWRALARTLPPDLASEAALALALAAGSVRTRTAVL
jgi:glycosyltransferase involved in cell wall biosynthesis